MDALIRQGRLLREQIRKHYDPGYETLPPEEQIAVAELEGWYIGVAAALEQGYGAQSPELMLWKDGLGRVQKELWEKVGKAPAQDGYFVQRQLEESLGLLAQIKLLSLRESAELIPSEIKESLARFRMNHPDPLKVAFLMMRFGKTGAHENIVSGIRKALEPLGIAVVRADDKQYHDDLFSNILTYVYGSGLGIAVFERIESEEFNPNVALEVGYMFALRKPVCLLKERTLRTLHADLIGKLYRVFDSLDPIGTIPLELSQWLRDKGLQESA
jgi:hypothetical protein